MSRSGPRKDREIRPGSLELWRRVTRMVSRSGFHAGPVQSAVEAVSNAGEASLPSLMAVWQGLRPEERRAALTIASALQLEGLEDHLKRVAGDPALALDLRLLALEELLSRGYSPEEGPIASLVKARSWLQSARRACHPESGEAPDLKVLGRQFAELSPEWRPDLAALFVKEMGEQSIVALPSIMGIDPLSDLKIVAALGELGREGAAAFLSQLSPPADPALAKAIRKALYSISTRGIVVAPPPERKVAPVAAAQTEAGEGIVTSIDHQGGRLVWLIRPSPLGGVHLLQALIKDRAGIVQFSATQVSRKVLRETRNKIRAAPELSATEVPYDYCCYLLEEAYSAGIAAGTGVPTEYQHWRSRLKPDAERVSFPLIYSLLKADEVGEDVLRPGAALRLSEIPELSNWLFDPQQLKEYAQRIADARESRIIVEPHTKASMVEEVYEEAARAVFDDEWRSLYRRRLEEMAALFHLRGRVEHAKDALAVALTLKETSPLMPVVPFALTLVKRGLDLIVEKEPVPQSPLIVPAQLGRPVPRGSRRIG